MASNNNVKASEHQESIGTSVGGKTTKIHMVGANENILLHFAITEGNMSDIKQAKNMAHIFQQATVLADKGYHCKEFRKILLKQNCDLIIPNKSNAVNLYEFNEALYKDRNKIERLINKAKHFRRIATRYEKKEKTFHSFVDFSASFIILR